jgi:AAA15 family ATPase/GTPase
MYLSKIRVKNYKSFRDSGDIEFKPGINLIVGQNNSGKTALLESIEIRLKNNFHKSINTNEVEPTYLEATVYVEANEINPYKLDTILIRKPSELNEQDAVSLFNEKIENDLEVLLKGYADGIITARDVLYEESVQGYSTYTLSKENEVYRASGTMNATEEELFWNKITRNFVSKIYRFDSERPNLGKSNVGESRELNPNASLLAQVLLNTKAHNDIVYERFCNLVSQVIPSVKWINSVPIDGGSSNEIRIWNVDRKTERDDLTIPLSECGTGIGQVLAILYVVVTSREPRTIIIDEPNSFLHPSAAQKLIQILNKKEFSHHQYFISTHSPEIVTASKPSTITMLNYEDGETKVEQIDLSNNDGIKKVFKDLGIEPATFAFANHILWVEGPTEEKVFSLILKDANIHNVVIKPTVPSEFRQNRKRFENVRHIFELHKTVSGTDSVISPKMTILLDKEIEKESENNDLIREFGENEFNFIPRAMFENYLIATEAIEYILNFTQETQNYTESDIEFEKPAFEISLENINKWIAEKKISKDFLPAKLKSQEPITDFEWLVNVDGAKLLDNLFKDFLGKPFGYERYKVEYGAKLTQWLLENKPEQLSELKEFLINLISDK